MCVCECVYAYFRAMGNELDGERYQRLQCYKRSKNNFPETAAFFSSIYWPAVSR